MTTEADAEITSPDTAEGQSLSALEEAVHESEDSPESLAKLADACLEAGRFRSEALAVFEKVLACRPRSAKFQKALSIALLIRQIGSLVASPARGRPVTLQETVETLDGLSEEYPHSPDIRKAMGDLCLLMNDPQGVVAHYEMALDLGAEPTLEFTQAFESAAGTVPFSSDDLLFFAKMYRVNGKTQKAIAILEQAVDQGGGESAGAALLEAYGIEDLSEEDAKALRPEAFERALRICLESGDEERAESLIKRLGELKISTGGMGLYFAKRLLDQGKFWEAFQRLRQYPLDAQIKETLNDLSERLEGENDYDRAAEVLRFINENDYLIQEGAQIQERNLEVAAELELADLHFKNQRYALAFEKYVGALKLGLHPVESVVEQIDAIVGRGERVDGSCLLFLGEYFRAKGQFDLAEKYLKRLLDNDPDHAEGIALLETVYESLIQEEPDNAAARVSCGRLYFRTGKLSMAIEHFTAAAQDAEMSGEAIRMLGRAFSESGDFAQSLEKYRSIKLHPADLDHLYDLHKRMDEAGMQGEAFQVLTMIRDVDPSFQDVAQRIARFGSKAGASKPATSMGVDSRMRNLIGDLATDRYRFVEKIGSGGMGEVYRIFDHKLNCHVAIKILREGLTNNNKALLRFIREAQYADQLNHPNIVHIFDFNISKVPGQSFITMEYVDGPSLREMLEEKFKDEVKIDTDYIGQILGYCVQLCDALDATHKKGIIHRDIKPDNIMVNSKGAVKITDFGILHVEESGATPTGALLGTPRYMSPEQVRGGMIDNRADIYAVGILLYEILTSSPPFISGDIAYQHVNVKATPPREIIPVISPSLNQIVMTCLEKEPGQRYQNARSLKACLLEEIKLLGGGSPVDKTTAGALGSMDEMDLD